MDSEEHKRLDLETPEASDAAAPQPPPRSVLDGSMDQYDAINEADRRWGSPDRRGIALKVADQCLVGLHDDRHAERAIYGRGSSYEAAFRDAEDNGHRANGAFASRPSKHPLYRDL